MTILKDEKLGAVIENTQNNPSKLRLGKNKCPKILEDLFIGMKQGDRKLFVLMGKSLQPFYQNMLTGI